jgi:secondary thiamine-phosphate synthase enzyme
MKQRLDHLTIGASGRKFTDITDQVRRFVAQAQINLGLVTLFIQHTSASLLIQENADPDVLTDLEDAFARFAPPTMNYRHMAEGPDDMPSHIRAALTQTSLSIPVNGGAPVLGTWQAIYVFEHRDSPHRRTIMVHAIGE